MVKSQSVMWPCLSKLSLFVTRIEGVLVSTLWTIGPFAEEFECDGKESKCHVVVTSHRYSYRE